MKPSDFKVGQEVYVVENRWRNEPAKYTEVVTKIGRKWVTIGEGWMQKRFDPMDMSLDGGDFVSPGHVHLSKNDYIEKEKVRTLWQDMSKKGYVECDFTELVQCANAMGMSDLADRVINEFDEREES